MTFFCYDGDGHSMVSLLEQRVTRKSGGHRQTPDLARCSGACTKCVARPVRPLNLVTTGMLSLVKFDRSRELWASGCGGQP